jgi:5-methylthioadenosine/S-adenosylhomocysteine deaminase
MKPKGSDTHMPREPLIKGGHVVTVDPAVGDIPDGDLLVTDGVITAVGYDLEPTAAKRGGG